LPVINRNTHISSNDLALFYGHNDIGHAKQNDVFSWHSSCPINFELDHGYKYNCYIHAQDITYFSLMLSVIVRR